MTQVTQTLATSLPLEHVHLDAFATVADAKKQQVSYIQDDAAQTTAVHTESFVSKAEANQALATIAKNLQLDDMPKELTIDNLAKIPLSVLAMSLTSAACKSVMQHQRLVSDGMKQSLDASEKLSQATLKNYRDQAQAALAQQQRQQTLGWVSNAIHWAVSIAEVVIGAIKFVGGICTGAINETAAGSAEFLAGITGLVGASIEMAALIEKAQGHDEKAEKLKAAAHKTFSVQTSLEMVGMLFDFASVIASTKVAAKTAKRTGDLMQHASGEMAEVGSKGTTVEQHLMTALSENATADVEAIAHTFAKDFLAPAQSSMERAMLGHITEDTVAHIVKNSIKSLIKSSAGQELTSETLQKVLQKQIHAQVRAACMKLSIHASSSPATVGQALTGTAQGTDNILNANVQEKMAHITSNLEQLQILQKVAQDMAKTLQNAFTKDTQLFAHSVQVGNQAIASIAQSNNSIINAFTRGNV